MKKINTYVVASFIMWAQTQVSKEVRRRWTTFPGQILLMAPQALFLTLTPTFPYHEINNPISPSF